MEKGKEVVAKVPVTCLPLPEDWRRVISVPIAGAYPPVFVTVSVPPKLMAPEVWILPYGVAELVGKLRVNVPVEF